MKPTYEELESLAAEQDALLLSYAKIAGSNAAKVQQLEAQVKKQAAENAHLRTSENWLMHSEEGVEMAAKHISNKLENSGVQVASLEWLAVELLREGKAGEVQS